MNMRLGLLASAVVLAAVALPACDVTYVGHHHAAEAVVVTDPAPYYVDEDVTIARYEPDQYVTIGGTFYYYHPERRTWIHVNRGRDWRPPARARVYHSWSEHPNYHRDNDGDRDHGRGRGRPQ